MTAAIQHPRRPVVDAMLDIETFGLKPGCTVLSIGLALFDPLDPDSKMHLEEKNQLYLVPQYVDSYLKKLHDNKVTMDWWKSQPIYNDLVTSASQSRISLDEVCRRVATFIQENGVEEIWCKGKDFDVPILIEVFSRCKVEWPLHYRDSTCSRDWCKRAFPGLETAGDRKDWPQRPRELQKFPAHHALGDALFQIHQVHEATRVLRKGIPSRPPIAPKEKKAAPRP